MADMKESRDEAKRLLTLS